MFLAAEPLLVARLQALCPSARKVETVADVAGLLERGQIAPALLVVFDRFLVADVQAGGDISRVGERWLVIAVAKHAAQRDSGGAVRSAAADILAEAYAAVTGWSPAPGFRPFYPVNPPPPAMSPSHGYFPLAFETRFVVDGAFAE